MTTTRWSLRGELPLLLVIAAMFAAAAWSWPRLPERMPTHWNLEGEVDGWGGRFEGLLLLPLVTVGTYLLFLVLPRLDPGRSNYAGFWTVFRVIRLAIVLVLAAIYGAMLASAQGVTVRMSLVMTLLVGALFVVLGFTMGKIRPNWFVGVRTPWTLSSKRSWTRSHRLAGWLFLVSGCGSLLLLAVSERVALVFLLASGAVLVVTVVIYSYVVWRGDNERVPPAGTSPAEDEG